MNRLAKDSLINSIYAEFISYGISPKEEIAKGNITLLKRIEEEYVMRGGNTEFTLKELAEALVELEER